MKKATYKYGPYTKQGRGQGQVKQGHQINMLHECRATHVLLVIWDVSFDSDIHFLDLTRGEVRVRSKFPNSEIAKKGKADGVTFF